MRNRGLYELNKVGVLSPHYPDVLRTFRRRSPADSAVGSSAPPGSHAAPPAPLRSPSLTLERRQRGAYPVPELKVRVLSGEPLVLLLTFHNQ